MSLSAALIILAIALVLAALIVAEWWSRRPKKPADPSCTVDRALDHYTSHPEQWTERDRLVIAELQDRDGQTVRALEASLARTVETALGAAEPLVELRRAIMEATDRFVMEETLYRPEADDEEPHRLSAGGVAVAEAGILRCYGMLRFGDYAPDDWYTHYVRVAEMNARNVSAMVDKALGGEASTLEASLHEPMTQAMREARESLLRHPPQTPVSSSAATLAAQALPSQRAPGRRQIDQLTDVMSERFERLFAGHTVQLDNGRLLSPAASVRLDAALLYALLANEYRRPTEAWRSIVEEALGSRSEATPSDDDELLAIAREAHRAWQRSQAGLEAALEATCNRVAIASPEGEATNPKALMKLLREDASALAREVQQVTRGTP